MGQIVMAPKGMCQTFTNFGEKLMMTGDSFHFLYVSMINKVHAKMDSDKAIAQNSFSGHGRFLSVRYFIPRETEDFP